MAFVATKPVEATMKTNEVRAPRFRPIAPKPVPAVAPPPTNAVDLSQQGRERKRGVRDLVPAPTDKRLRGAPPSYSYPSHPYRATPWTSSPQAPKVIVPRPARPVRTTISVDIGSVTGANSVKLAARRTTAAQLEAEIERDAFPAVISGPGNRVLRANDAYKALVGQPVCPWLDYLPGGSAAGASRRINGEVVLDLRRFASSGTARASAAGGAFWCNSRISWERDGTLTYFAAPCDVMGFDCGSSDYLFVWRFDTTRGSVFCFAA